MRGGPGSNHHFVQDRGNLAYHGISAHSAVPYESRNHCLIYIIVHILQVFTHLYFFKLQKLSEFYTVSYAPPSPGQKNSGLAIKTSYEHNGTIDHEPL
jgi:hypothetical protein